MFIPRIAFIANRVAGFALPLIAIITLVGCAASGPTESPQFGALVAQSVPKDSGNILLIGTGEWSPNTRGFAVMPTKYSIPGVITIAEHAVVFSQWDAASESYIPMKRINLSQISSVKLDKFGLSRALIIQSEDLSCDTFSFTKANGSFVDGHKTEDATRVLQAATGPAKALH